MITFLPQLLGYSGGGLLLPAPTLLTPATAASSATITTPSIAPSPGALLLFCIAARDDTESHTIVNADPVVTGLSIASSWETITETQLETDVSRYVGVSLQMAYCNVSPGTGTLRGNLTSSSFNVVAQVFEVSQGYDTTLSSYPDATNGTETTSLALNFSSGPATSSLIFSWSAMTGTAGGTYTEPTGHTPFTSVNEGTNIIAKASYKLLSGAQNNSWTGLDANDATAGIIVEILQQ